MSTNTQDWQSVESEQDLAKPRKPTWDPLAYLAVLVILAAIMALMAMFCSIGSAERMPDRPHTSPTTLTPDD